MIRWLSNKILQLVKVPAEPQPPDGSAGSARVFRSGRNYYHWRLGLWFSTNLNKDFRTVRSQARTRLDTRSVRRASGFVVCSACSAAW